jgi:hypothetical protein
MSCYHAKVFLFGNGEARTKKDYLGGKGSAYEFDGRQNHSSALFSGRNLSGNRRSPARAVGFSFFNKVEDFK